MGLSPNHLLCIQQFSDSIYVHRSHTHEGRRIEFTTHPSEDSPHLVLATTSFPEVSDRGELCVNGLPVEPTVVEVHDCFLSILLSAELRDIQRYDQPRKIRMTIQLYNVAFNFGSMLVYQH